MSSEKPILEIDNLVVDYETEDGVVHAVTGMNLSLGKKKTLGFVGETGAGKTTTALAILRLIPDPPGVIKDGSIKLNGVNILDLSIGEMRKLRGNFVSMKSPRLLRLTRTSQGERRLNSHVRCLRLSVYPQTVYLTIPISFPGVCVRGS